MIMYVNWITVPVAALECSMEAKYVNCTPMTPESAKNRIDILEAGVTVLLQTICFAVLTEDRNISAALIANKDGCSAIAAKQYIDASGDGDLARFAGLEQIDMWQDYHTVSGGSTGLVFGMAGVDIDRMVKENPQGAVKLSSAELDATGKRT